MLETEWRKVNRLLEWEGQREDCEFDEKYETAVERTSDKLACLAKQSRRVGATKDLLSAILAL